MRWKPYHKMAVVKRVKSVLWNFYKLGVPDTHARIQTMRDDLRNLAGQGALDELDAAKRAAGLDALVPRAGA